MDACALDPAENSRVEVDPAHPVRRLAPAGLGCVRDAPARSLTRPPGTADTPGVRVSSTDFASALVGSLRSGLLAIDGDGTVRAANPEACRTLGGAEAAPADWLGRDVRAVLRAQPAVARLLLAALDGADRPSRAELVLAAGGSASARTIGFTLTAVRDGAGAVVGAAIFFRDLTPFERMDEQERLRERLAALGQMAAGLAHEIRNPLAGMEVIAGLLRRRWEGQEGREEDQSLLAELVGELRSLASTVTQSLEFVRPLDLVREPVDPVAMIEDALRLARLRVPWSGEVERRYDARIETAVLDREQLRSVLVNLLVNALEAMQAGGGSRLRLVARLDARDEAAESGTWAVREGAQDPPPSRSVVSDALVVAVEDDGPGVPDTLREHVFYPFFTTKERGSGVGLATAQKIVASHGGTLSLEPAEPRGARFVIRLPLGAPGAAGAGAGQRGVAA